MPPHTPTDTPRPPVETPTVPAVAEVITHLEEREILYLDGGQFPTEIWKVDLRTEDKTRLFYSEEPGFRVNKVVLSPDRAFLAFNSTVYDPLNQAHPRSTALQIMHTDGSGMHTLVEIDEPDVLIGGPAWSPDGSTLAYIEVSPVYPAITPGISPTLYLHSFELDSRRDQIITDDGGGFDWSPEGDRMVVAGMHVLYVFDLNSGEQKTLWEDEELFFGSVAWQPDGEQVAVSVEGKSPSSPGSESGLYVIDVASEMRHQLVSGDIGRVYWSPDGSELVYVTFATRATELWSVSVEGGSPVRLLGPTVVLGFPAWSTDGEALLLAVEEEAAISYWISVIAVQDRSLLKLVLTETMHPYSAW
jgi:Tol biopolymer transport system component